MIFANGMHRLVLSGQKSETRRPVKPDETHCRFRPEHDYAVQSSPKDSHGFIRVLAVERQRLGDIDIASVKREGFKSSVEFREHWRELHGCWDPDMEVWAIVFMLTEEIRLLPRDSTLGTVHSDSEALGYDSERAGRGREIEPERVDRASEARFSADADARMDRRREVMRSRLAQLRQKGIEHIKAGRDPAPVLEAALEQMEEEAA